MISTHTLLDNPSQCAFAMKSIVDMMGTDGTPISITIKTLNGDVTNTLNFKKKLYGPFLWMGFNCLKARATSRRQFTFYSVAVEGLKVCAATASGKNRSVKIPKSFSQDELEVDAEDIATPEKIAQWEYLDEILHEISQSSAVEIALLIGANCLKALEPNKIISSRNGRPYAFRTILGQCVLGPVLKRLI